jgi:hypothetical protein
MRRKIFQEKFIDFINTFSIWVVLGSFSTYLFFGMLYGLKPNYDVGLILSLSMWVIYTIDHLIDGYKLKEQAFSIRHKQHYLYKNWLIVFTIISSIVICYLVFFKMPKHYFQMGYVLLGLTIFHFVINSLIKRRAKNRVFLKEVFISFVVTLGFAGLPLGSNNLIIPDGLYILVLSFFCINLSNLLLFSYFDFESDERSNFLSAAHVYGKEVSRKVAYILNISSLLAIGVLAFNNLFQIGALMVLVLMNLTLLFIALNPSTFKDKDRYRFYGDLIYLYPVVILPFL